MSIISKFFKQTNERKIIKYQKDIDIINNLEKKFEEKSDKQLSQLSQELKKRLEDGESLDDLLAEAFAGVREAAKRTIGQRHFDVQLIGGIVLHQGKIAEMKTGEGKTLVATLPLYLNAISGKGAHLVTVNDFLAKFQGQWMGRVYNALGLTTGIIGHEASWIFSELNQESDDPTWNHLLPVSRRQAYEADITYGTNNEFGFDYLRDNMVGSLSQKSQRDLNYAIIDEVDSILIDEARTPLIISAPARESTDLYKKFADIVKRLNEKDYELDEKDRAVSLTDDGIQKVENWLNIKNLYDPSNVSLIHHCEEALKAQILFKKDKDYVVKNGEIIIVDEFTGRLMQGRRYSEGLHQAIEAKENVEVKKESETLATISFQNLFRLYNKLSGMTGTALTESEEFYKIYGLEVESIPTNKPMVREDYQDKIFKTEEAKYNAVVSEIKSRNEKGQPILVGTASISKNEKLSKLLKLEGIKHELLNAKKHEQEAKVIAQAGRLGGVTIATNIAGRGVDIILGGTPPDKIKELELKVKNQDDRNNKKDEDSVGLSKLSRDKRSIEDWQKEHDKVIGLGGLAVIGTERHEARRIDNQLRGRAGRQGDPGESIFFVSMEDDLMRIFGGDRMKNMMDRLGLPDSVPIEHKLVSKSIESAQKKVEGHNFDIRKHLVEYDDVMNRHREAIYRKRGLILEGKGKEEDGKVVELHEEVLSLFSEEELKIYIQKFREIDKEILSQIERQVYLRVIDQLWIEHLNYMEELRTGIGLRGYGQKDPLVEYKQEAYAMFERLIVNIEDEVAGILMRIDKIERTEPEVQLQSKQNLIEKGADENASSEVLRQDNKEIKESEHEPANQSSNSGVSVTVRQRGEVQTSLSSQMSQNTYPKVGRNEKCPCGSGLKYKKCHGK